MSLILQHIKEVTATENKPCDGVQMMFDFMNGLTTIQKQYYIFDLFRMRKMKIQPTEKYLNIIFVDTESGEQIEINVKKNVHNKLIVRKVYPYNIIKLFL